MNRTALFVSCIFLMLLVSCKENSYKQDIKFRLVHIGFDCPFSPDEYHLYPWEMFLGVLAENRTDSIFRINTINHQYAQEKGKQFGYLQWIVDGDTLDMYSRAGLVELQPDSIFGVGLITAQDSILLSKFNIEERNDSTWIKNRLEPLIRRSRMRFVPIPEDYADVPEGQAIIRSPIEVDLSSFEIDYFLGGRGYLRFKYDQGKIQHNGWEPSNAEN